jgi:hypothetical protein
MRTTLRLIAACAAAAILAPAAGAQESQRDNSFKWTGDIAAGRTVYARNLNGGVQVEAGTGAAAEVRAEKKWRKGDPKEVKVTAEKTAKGDILVCVIYEGRETRCDEDGYNARGSDSWWRDHKDNDVSVQLTIVLPKGVKLDASTVNGGIDISGATAAVKATTVNGGIEASSLGGPVLATTVNGGIKVKTGSLGDGPVKFSTVNGGIVLSLPAELNANLEMSTVNGSVTSEDFPITVQGRFDRRRISGTIGKGGPELRVSTVNGSITLRKN